MEKVRIEEKGDIAVLRLDNGVTNAMGSEMIGDLLEAVAQIRDNFKGMVLAGGEKFFSMGFDLPGLLPLDRTGMSDFFYGFNDACLALYTLPVPTACAVRAHAVAGGHILATTCDFRIAAEGKTKFGLNEIHLGVPVPYLADLIQRQLVPERAATNMLYQGSLFPVNEAKAMGLVDEVAAKEDVEDRAVKMVSELAALPAAAFAAIKENRVESVRRKYEKRFREKNEAFLDLWCTPETQQGLQAAAKKF
jgi:Delta3-Delta2-enoyl-CoA isomerase